MQRLNGDSPTRPDDSETLGSPKTTPGQSVYLQGLSMGAHGLYDALRTMSSGSTMVKMSRKALAAHLGIDARTLDRYTRELVSAGMLSVSSQRSHTGRFAGNNYTLPDYRHPERTFEGGDFGAAIA